MDCFILNNLHSSTITGSNLSISAFSKHVLAYLLCSNFDKRMHTEKNWPWNKNPTQDIQSQGSHSNFISATWCMALQEGFTLQEHTEFRARCHWHLCRGMCEKVGTGSSPGPSMFHAGDSLRPCAWYRRITVLSICAFRSAHYTRGTRDDARSPLNIGIRESRKHHPAGLYR